MSPTVATYLGFVVSALIIIWGAIELGKRLYRSKKMSERMINTWIPLEPTSPTPSAKDPSTGLIDDDQEENALHDGDNRAQQNGHYSESKKHL